MRKSIVIALAVFLFLCGALSLAADELELRIFKIKYGLAGNLFEVVNNLKSPKGKVSVDRHTNSFIVLDKPEYLERMAQVLDELDKEPKQVELRVMIAEVATSALTEIGITSSSVIIPKSKLRASLDFLSIRNDTSVKSEMRVRTISGHPAKLQVTKDMVYEEEAVRFADGGETVNYAREPIGDFLEVLPRVNDDETINVVLRPSSTSLEGEGDIYEKSVLTQINLHPGDTLVIGGLDSDKKVTRERSAPGTGVALSQGTKSGGKKMVIFLTADIVD